MERQLDKALVQQFARRLFGLYTSGMLTLMVDNGNGPGVTDGVDQATMPASRSFPYAQPANPHPPSLPALTLPL